MKQTFLLLIALLVTAKLFCQDKRVKELVSQGVELHDKGLYGEAITYYKEALKIDPDSPEANYELSYTYMVSEQYENAILYSTKVIENNRYYQLEAYVVLGTSYDMLGNPEEAIEAYKKGLEKFPDSYLLHFNLGITLFNQNDYGNAEKEAINAIEDNPKHASSHILLSAIMQEEGYRVKSLLSLYYALMLEPDSKRSPMNYNSLIKQLGQGVEKKSKNEINVNVPFTSSKDSVFSAAELMISLLAATKYSGDNKGKTDMEFFVDTNKSLFAALGELKNDNFGIWWDFYINIFTDLVETNNCEAFSYYIAQSSNSPEVAKWIKHNPEKMKQFEEWMLK